MDFYRHDAGDPQWLAKISEFHGHLGPWLVAGALVGRDAIQRLGTPGHWKIDVTCCMPTDRHRTPFTCLLDGLQASCGATMGKRNLHLAGGGEGAADLWPVVRVVRLPDKDRPAEGLIYEATCELHARLRQITPERLEEGSRDLAAQPVTKLFRIAAMTTADLAGGGHAQPERGQAG